MKEPPPDPQLSILFGWCLILLLGLPIGGFTAWHVGSKAAATTWPRTSAEILDSKLYRTHRPTQWCLQLKLRYRVGETTYASRRTSSSRFAGTACDREQHVMSVRLERMQPGARMTVRYDPQDPDNAIVYLAPVVEFIDAFLGITAAVWFGCGIAMIRFGKRLRREQDAARAGSAKPALR